MRRLQLIIWAPLLLACGCARYGGVSLTAAAGAGDTATVRTLLAQGADPNQKDGHGLTPLIAAARAGSLATLEELLHHHADPNLGGGVNGWTPMMQAIHKNQIGSVRALLDGGAQVDGRGRSGETALMMAAGYSYTRIVELLLDRGADPRAETPDGLNVLAVALGGVPDLDHFTLGACHTETVRVLKRRYPDLHLPNNLWARVAQIAGGVAKLRGCAY